MDMDKDSIEMELKYRGYSLVPRLAGNDPRLKAENLRWRVTSNHIDWDWDFKTLEEVVEFIGKEKEIFLKCIVGYLNKENDYE